MNLEKNDKAPPIGHIVICGGGLAGRMTAAALSRQLPPSTQITLADCKDTSDTDLFYGSVTAPTSYAFNLSIGLSEPKLVLESDATFSWGTEYVRWGDESRSWIQCFHLPLPVIDGVLFHHYLAQQGVQSLEPFLVSAVAARNGAFAHPPQQPRQPGQHLLSRAEYGYQFDPASHARLFEACTDKTRVRRVDARLSDVECDETGVASIRLSDGQSLTADLYVDCTGPEAALLSRLGGTFSGNRRVRAAMRRKSVAGPGAPLRTVTAESYGWKAETPLRGRAACLAVYDPEMEAAALSALGGDPERAADATLGRRAEAWSGNCVAIGQAAGVVEPLTPAPVMLLERDIERLLSLIPFSADMSVERREFNRRFVEDHEHAGLFTRALFETENHPDTSYWRAARKEPVAEKLARKLELFASRGLLAAYDLEPFNPEDWIILHYGMGRRAKRYDRTADRAPAAKVRQYLANMKRDIETAVKTMPGHAAYMNDLTQYLAKNKV